MSIADITTELDLLQRYGKVHPLPESLHEWNGTLIDYVELIYGLQEVGCIDNGKITVTELASCFNRMFGMTIKEKIQFRRNISNGDIQKTNLRIPVRQILP